MIVNGHDEGGRDSFFPGVVSEGLAQGVTADAALQIQIADRFFDDPEGIGPVYGMIVPHPAFIDEILR